MSKFFEAAQKHKESFLGGVPFPSDGLAVPAAAPRVSAKAESPGQVSNGPPAQPRRYRTVAIRVLAGAPVVPFDGTHPQAAEQYRLIRTKIVQHPLQARTLCISSTSPGDGKTVNALNIACALSLKGDTKVLLIDVDMRRPQLSTLLGVPGNPGLAEYLAGACTLQEAIVQLAELPRLYFLPAGRCPPNPTELLDSEGWRRTVDCFRQEFDCLVLDSPPVGVVADYDLIQSVCEGVILIARPGYSNRGLLQKGISRIPEEKFLGVLINCVEDWFLWRTDESYYGYGEPRRD